MAFFPLASIQNTKGYTSLHNFSPNQWELTDAKKKYSGRFFLTEKNGKRKN